jgi:hypothetical protein
VSGSVATGLVLALGSAAALSWGFVVQHGAASSMPPLTLRRPVRSLALLFRARRWLLGFVVGLAGWGLYVGALALAPLALVQGASAVGIALMAALVGRLTDLERAAVALAVAGLLLLAVSLVGTGAPTGHGHAGAVAAWIAVSVAAAAVAAGPGARLLAGGAGLGVAAGILYAAGDVGTKAALPGGGRLAFVPVLLACHGLAFASLQLGFQRGGALATAGMASLWTNALPIAAGTVLFGETLPHGFRGAARLAAFALLVAGAALLSRPEGRELTDQSVNRTLGGRWPRSNRRLPAASRSR